MQVNTRDDVASSSQFDTDDAAKGVENELGNHCCDSDFDCVCMDAFGSAQI